MGGCEVDLVSSPVEGELHGLPLTNIQDGTINIINQLVHNSSSHTRIVSEKQRRIEFASHEMCRAN